MTNSNKKWLALVAISLGVAIIIMDATVVNVSLPVVIRDLKLSTTQAEWINTIYSLVFAALLLTTGKLGDIFGRRRLFLAGIAVFVLGSIFAGASNGPGALITSRLIQGLGAAMILPATLSSINAIYKGRDRGIAFAVWGSTIGGMAAIGPLVGSWLTTDFTWRWAFLINIPICALVLAFTLLFVPETKDNNSGKRIDVLGVLTSSLGFGAIVFGLIEAQRYGWILQSGGAVSPVLFALIGGAALVAGFIILQSRNAKKGSASLINLRLFRITSFRIGSVAALIVSAGEFGLLFTLPLLLQNALGYSALGTGWLIVSLALGTFIISGATPQLTKRIGSKRVVQIGLLAEAVAIGLLALVLTSTVATWPIALLLFLYGLGVGMATAQLTSVILVEVPESESGQASGIQSTVRQLGAALGVAIMGAILIGALARYTTSNLTHTTLPAAQQSAIVDAVKNSAGSAIPELQRAQATSAAGDIAAAGLVHASKITLGVAAVVILIGVMATRPLKNKQSQPAA